LGYKIVNFITTSDTADVLYKLTKLPRQHKIIANTLHFSSWTDIIRITQTTTTVVHAL